MSRLFALVFLGLAGCVPPVIGAGAIVRPVRLPVLTAPTLPYEDFSFFTPDGLNLRGWLFKPSGPARGVVVFLHGKDNNRSYGRRVAERLVPLGYTVLAYDQRAHGDSEGAHCTYGVREKADLSAALDHLVLAPGTPVVVIGHSLGGAVALQAAANDSRIRGAVAIASFSDLDTIVDERTPWFVHEDTFLASKQAAERSGRFYFKAASPLRAAPMIQVPVLLIHGTADSYTAPSHAQKLYEALPPSKRELAWIHDATHNDVVSRNDTWRRITKWLDSGLTTAASAPSVSEPKPKPKLSASLSSQPPTEPAKPRKKTRAKRGQATFSRTGEVTPVGKK